MSISNSNNSEEQMNVIVLAIEGLGARFLGPYGNTWIDTPAINQLAAQGILFEYAVAESLSSGQCMNSLMSDMIAMSNDTDAFLIHDQGDFEGAAGGTNWFEDRLFVEQLHDIGPCASFSETHLAKMFAALFAKIEEQSAAFKSGSLPFLGWCESRALTSHWDAPSELAFRFASEDDPDPYAGRLPPAGVFDLQVEDPDTFLAMSHAYAAQIVVLDSCIAALFACLETLEMNACTSVILTSSHGYPLGEHGFVGANSGCLYGEATHVPLIITHPDSSFQSRRYQSVVQHQSLKGFLSTLIGNQMNLTQLTNDLDAFPFATCRIGHDWMIQSPSWMLLELQGLDSTTNQKLFVKPDDRWEVNDVAGLCGEITEGLSGMLAKRLNMDETAFKSVEYEPKLATSFH